MVETAPSHVTPSAWVVAHAAYIPQGGCVLDVACGRGRHALYLAARGWAVHAVDRDPDALAGVAAQAATLPPGAALTTEALDLETGRCDLGHHAYDGIVVVHYLHRPLMPAIVDAVVPGGVLIYETFTAAQAARGRPSNPAFLLEPGELPALVAPLDVLHYREGDIDGRFVASIVAARR